MRHVKKLFEIDELLKNDLSLTSSTYYRKNVDIMHKPNSMQTIKTFVKIIEINMHLFFTIKSSFFNDINAK